MIQWLKYACIVEREELSLQQSSDATKFDAANIHAEARELQITEVHVSKQAGSPSGKATEQSSNACTDSTAGTCFNAQNSSCSQQSLAVLLKFYLPLAAASILMMVTHSVVSGAVARTLYPTIALAAYSASYSVGQVFQSPCYGLNRMCLKFTDGKRSHKKVAQVTLMILAVIVLLLAAVSWTPLAQIIFQDVLGVSEEVCRMAVPSLRVFIFWPISVSLRSIFQAPIVISKQTIWLTTNMIARVVVMFLAAAILPVIWPVGPVGATILMLGLCTEAFMTFIASKKGIPPLEEEGPGELIPSTSQILKFALPLVIASPIQNIGRPIITAALSRTVTPEVTLAGYQVALSFSFIFASITYNIYQMVIIFVKDRQSFKQIKRFSAALGVIAMIGLWICSIPQVGSWIFGSIIKTPPEIIPEALRTLAFVAIMPFMTAFAEFYGGILMMNQHTIGVTAAKFSNMLVSSLVVTGLVRAYPVMGAAAGSISLVLGSAAEAIVCYLVVRSSPDYRRYMPA